jgi:phosphate transport system permease protein
MSIVDVSALQRPNDRLRRRRVVNRSMELLAWVAAAIGVAILAIVVWSVAKRGASELNFDLLTKPQAQNSFALHPPPQGLANAFAGSLVIVGLATLMALPVGILVAIYVNEFAPRAIKNGVGLALDVLNGIPAIVIAIFVFGLLVVGNGQSGFAGAFALAVLMLPLVARSTIEVLALVPDSLREASLGLGVARWRTTLGIVLPQTIGGIVTGRCSPSPVSPARPHRCSSPPRSSEQRSAGIPTTPSFPSRSRSSSSRSRRIPPITRAPGLPRSCCCCSSSSRA